MISKLFLGMSLVGAEWVLYLLILLSVVSVAIMFERISFYRKASSQIAVFRSQIREAVSLGEWSRALDLAKNRAIAQKSLAPDLESGMALALLQAKDKGIRATEVLEQLANDPVISSKIEWERGLSSLATIGNNAPFVGLFGTVLGIIKAFHDLSQQSQGMAASVTAGISEALIATAVGILVAIPAVMAFNYFQRRNKVALSEAESLKSFMVGKISG